MRFFMRRSIDRSKQYVADLKKGNSGNWKWLTAKPVPLASLHRSLWRSAEPSSSFYVLLTLAGTIATFGLLANSAATIIGAMIVAPLMGPILGVAFSMVMGNRRLLKRSLLAVVSGTGLVILLSLIICQLTGLSSLTSEIAARTAPTLLDLGVALAAGTAGAYAKSRREISDALPGVAIAVALVPPLSVVGVGLATQMPAIAAGSFLLFLTNLVGIIFSGSVVFLLQRYGSIARAKRGLMVAITGLIVLAIPLGLAFQDLVMEQRIREKIRVLIDEETVTFADQDIRRFEVHRHDHQLMVSIDIVAPANSISANQVQLVRDFLQQRLGQPLRLEVKLIPAEQFSAE